MRLRTRSSRALFATLAAGTLLLSGCGGDDDSAGGGGDGKTIKIAIAGEKPYSYMEDGEPTGATVALHEEIFKNLGYENVEAEVVEWDGLIPGLNAGRYDVVSAGMSILPERCEQAAFGDPEIMYTTAFAVPKGNPEGLEDMDDIAESDVRLAVINGAIEQTYAEELGIDGVTTVNSAEDGYAAVQNGQADAFALTGISVRTWVEENPDAGLEATDSFEAVVKDVVQVGAGATVFREKDSKLREDYNKELAKITGSTEAYEDVLGEFGFTDAERPPENITTDMLCKGELPSVDEYESSN
ncbi:polar amino acid transport system substrate-binding protein [Nocardioides luteus]|uniref:ABC transporter substrate-binding protein n=1 Tax=Nocardioides luteus TaxID=1844 RepID=A0ABQ5T3G4_9ACTN|nr:transporter substrate-binding domain-containing protein [Nocardioides luteus]MDR7309616.1 polar amino acid transport system substrate-binding protein [Nocardioides luteus]GGR52350.1 ABC transporter substrate-binding protein [Nocardioides luteus]GLJ70601.1 ABC transporter substrate-binding protein [Nocardioides luteus]